MKGPEPQRFGPLLLNEDRIFSGMKENQIYVKIADYQDPQDAAALLNILNSYSLNCYLLPTAEITLKLNNEKR